MGVYPSDFELKDALMRDLGEVTAARQLLDVAGHYGRPDVFRLITTNSP